MKTKVTLFVPLLLAAAACAQSAPPAAPAAAPAAAKAQESKAQDSTISMKSFMFSPSSLTVTTGTTVKWKNLDGEPHTVRSIDNSFHSDALDQNDSFSFKFDKPGTYKYVCSIHPQMVGTIVVK